MTNLLIVMTITLLLIVMTTYGSKIDCANEFF